MSFFLSFFLSFDVAQEARRRREAIWGALLLLCSGAVGAGAPRGCGRQCAESLKEAARGDAGDLQRAPGGVGPSIDCQPTGGALLSSHS